MTEPNDIFNQATAVTPDFYLQSNYFTNDSVSPGDPDDYFRFYNLYGPSTLYAVVNGLSADADLYVYDQNANEIGRSILGSNLSETINISLPAGNEYYYVRVKSYQSANTTNYGLLLYNDYSGSQLYNARDLGFSWGQSSNKYWAFRQTQWQEYLDYRDNVDVVRFIMEAPGTVSLRVPGTDGFPGGGLFGRMELVNIEGQVLSVVSGPFNLGLTIDRVSLPADTYFVRYVQSSGSDTYNLRIVSDYAGDTTATARNVGNLTNNDRQFYDMVGNPSIPTYEDTNDLYKFNLTQAALVTLRLDLDTDNFPVPTFDANLRLARDNNNDGFISANEVLLSSTQLGDDQIATNLSAGTYYAQVLPNGAYTNYQLDIKSRVSVIISEDPDDTIGEVVNRAGNTKTLGQFADFTLDVSTDVDLIKFTVLAGQKVGFDVDSRNASNLNTYLRIFKPDGAQLAANDNGIAPGETNSQFSYLTYTFPQAGTYYVGTSLIPNSNYNPVTGSGDVSGAGATGTYRLYLNDLGRVIINDDTDDTIGEVVNQAASTRTLGQFADFSLNVSTDVDLIKFTVLAGQKVGFDVDSRNASNLNTYLRIFKPDGAQLAANDNGIAPGETNSQFSYLTYTFPQAGTYYVGTSLIPNSNYNPITATGDVSGAGATGNYRLSLNDLGRVITGNASNNSLTGGNGPDSISGLGGNDNLNGGGGNDTLVGGIGNDQLTGGIGGDAFVFANISDRLDTISDFNGSLGDILQISATGFGSGLTRGVLGANRFRSGAGIATANTTSQRFIYNNSNGALFFDADGSATGSNPLQLATLSNRPSLIPSQIVVI